MQTYKNELYHWGIKGMKWGVRRYQNKDGTLTAAGKKHYNGDGNAGEEAEQVEYAPKRTGKDASACVQGLSGHYRAGGTEPGEGGVKLTETFILEHVGDLAFTLLGAAVGFLWKKLMDMVKEQKYLHDGVLAMLHDRLYLICTHYIKMGYIDTDGLDNVGIIYQAYHGLKGNGTGTNLYKRVCALPIKEGDEPRLELP